MSYFGQIIFGLAVTVAVLWPSHYPYSQAPNINSQQQPKDSISSQHASGDVPSAPVDIAREQQNQHRSENASDTTVFGIKPGEWLLAIVTWMLWLATVRLVSEGKSTAERQLRAYVFIDSAQVVNVIEGNGSPEAHVVIKNYGQTPAYELVNVSGFAIDQYPTPSTLNLTVRDEEFGITGKTAMALGPGCESFSITPSKAPPVPPDIRAEFVNGTRIAYVYGEVRYKDVFGTERRTEYRLMMGGPAGVRGDQLVGCDEGNKAT